MADVERAVGEEGSSPRGRGKRRRRPWQAPWRRLIPAWAGKTRRRFRRAPTRRAHPRVGGENFVTGAAHGFARGSSPRGRGKLRTGSRVRSFPGLIPAWAGKTDPPSGPHAAHRAHPRVGGENCIVWMTSARASGSSPRGRGKRRVRAAPARPRRLIPAWAGKTPQRNTPHPQNQAHPRVGGENFAPAFCRATKGGSSPRGRGKPRGSQAEALDRRLIPAWAGKTSR